MTTTIDGRPARSGGRAKRDGTGGPPARRPRMDPRIRERRTAVLRAQGRHRLRLLVLLVSLPLVVLLCVLALRSSFLSVRHIHVVGVRETSTGAVERALAGALRHPMVSVNAAALEAQVDALSWVQRATVSRSWPSTLEVKVSERTPVASVQSGTSWAELDATGRVLTLVRSAPSGQPRLSGSAAAGLRPGGSVGPQMRAELAVAAAVPASLRAEVDGIGPDPDGGVQLTLAPPSVAKVEMGPALQLGPKMAALQTVLAQVDLTGVTVIDVRVPGQPALTRP
jgi:cell division protein FtsQ